MKSRNILNIIALFVLISCFSATYCYAVDVTFQWDANSESDIAGYKIYYKQDSQSLPFNGTGAVQGPSPVDVGNLTTKLLTGLDPSRTYYFAVTAYNTSGIESVYSNICLLYTSPSPRDRTRSRMPSSA